MTALECTAKCGECDWSQPATSMKEADKACDRHAKDTQHSTSWHCQPVTDKG